MLACLVYCCNNRLMFFYLVCGLRKIKKCHYLACDDFFKLTVEVENFCQ